MLSNWRHAGFSALPVNQVSKFGCCRLWFSTARDLQWPPNACFFQHLSPCSRISLLVCCELFLQRRAWWLSLHCYPSNIKMSCLHNPMRSGGHISIEVFIWKISIPRYTRMFNSTLSVVSLKTSCSKWFQKHNVPWAWPWLAFPIHTSTSSTLNTIDLV